MRLSELGELGLLAELERRGLARGIEHDAAQLARRSRRHAGRARRGRPLPARLDVAGATSASRRRRSTSATSPRRAPSREALLVTLGAPGETELEDVLELYEGLERAGRAGRRRRHDARRAARTCRVTALGRSERVPGRAGAQPGRPARRHRPARRRGRGLPRRSAYARPPLAARGRPPPRRGRARAARRLGRARRRRRPPRRALGLPARDRARAGPARRGRRASRTSASARTTSCSPRRPDAARLRGDRPLRGGRRAWKSASTASRRRSRAGSTSAGGKPEPATCADLRRVGEAMSACWSFMVRRLLWAVSCSWRVITLITFVIFFMLPDADQRGAPGRSSTPNLADAVEPAAPARCPTSTCTSSAGRRARRPRPLARQPLSRQRRSSAGAAR